MLSEEKVNDHDNYMNELEMINYDVKVQDMDDMDALSELSEKSMDSE